MYTFKPEDFSYNGYYYLLRKNKDKQLLDYIYEVTNVKQLYSSYSLNLVDIVFKDKTLPLDGLDNSFISIYFVAKVDGEAAKDICVYPAKSIEYIESHTKLLEILSSSSSSSLILGCMIMNSLKDFKLETKATNLLFNTTEAICVQLKP